MQKINEEGLQLIKKFEGLRLKSYVDVAGHRTIGYGHMNDNMTVSSVITESQAEELLLKDLTAAESAIASFVKAPLTDNQFSSLVSFVFNVGASNLRSSTLLKLINNKEYNAAAEEFVKWDHAGGKEDPGLLKRRLAEKELFLKV